MGVHVQTKIKSIINCNYTWDDVYLLFDMEPKKRKSTSYNIVCPIDDINVIQSCLTDKCNLILSTRHAFIDFRVDIGGEALWYHVFKGQKLIILIRQTVCNLEIYEQYFNNNDSDNKSMIFFKEIVKQNPENIFCIYLRQGMTVIIPNAYIYAEYSPIDTIAFNRNVVTNVGIYHDVSNEKKIIHRTMLKLIEVIQMNKMTANQMVLKIIQVIIMNKKK